jgi:serine/threonine-protein kinase RIM15
MFGDSESGAMDDIPVVISRKATGDWDESGLGIAEADILSGMEGSPKPIPHLLTQQSAPGQMENGSRPAEGVKGRRDTATERKVAEATDSADDEDEEVGQRDKQRRRGSKVVAGKAGLPSSKLGIEMMRANSHDSMTFGSESTPEAVTQVATTPLDEKEAAMIEYGDLYIAKTPPDAGRLSVEVTPRPGQSTRPKDGGLHEGNDDGNGVDGTEEEGEEAEEEEEEEATPRPPGRSER